MTNQDTNFGALLRRERQAKKLGLREMAKKIGVSATYLSKVERLESPPPTEEKVRAISQIIGYDPDLLLAMAGRIPSDVSNIIKRKPIQMAGLLRTTGDLGDDEIARLVETAKNEKMKEPPNGFAPKTER